MFFSPAKTGKFKTGESPNIISHDSIPKSPIDKDQSLEDSFIRYEEQAMREENESENPANQNSVEIIQEMDAEIQNLKFQLNKINHEKEEKENQYTKEIDNLKETIQSLQVQLQFASSKKESVDRYLSEQQELNTDLSNRLLQLDPMLLPEDDSKSTKEINIRPDALISRIRALELKLSTETQRSQELEKELETRKNHFLEEISRLSMEISNANSEESSESTNPNLTQNEILLEREISSLRSQLNLLSDIQKSMSEHLQRELEANSNLSSELLDSQMKLEDSLNKNANNDSILNTLMTMLNASDPFDLITKVRRLIADNNHSHQQRSELVSLQVEYQKEILINQRYQEELRELKEQLCNKPYNSLLSTQENSIEEMKNEYEKRISHSEEMNLSKVNKLESIKRRDHLLREKFFNLPISQQNDMNKALFEIFDCLAENSNSENDDFDLYPELEEKVKTIQELAIDLVPLDALVRTMQQLKQFSDIIDEINSHCIALQTKYDSLHEKLVKYVKSTQFMNRYKGRLNNTMNVPQRLAKPPTSSRHNKSALVGAGSNNSFMDSFIDANSDLSRVADFSNMSFSRSPIVANGTPKIGARPYPMKERSNAVSPAWMPRPSPSYQIREPEND